MGKAATFKDDNIKELARKYVRSCPELSKNIPTHNGDGLERKSDVVLRALGCASRNLRVENSRRNIVPNKTVEFYVRDFIEINKLDWVIQTKKVYEFLDINTTSEVSTK